MCRRLLCLIVILLAFGLVSDVSAALVGRWKLDEGSGTTTADATGNGHDGTFQGNPQWVEGLFGGALEFGGNPDRVDVPYSEQLNPENEFSVTVWANVDPTGGGHRSPITSRDDSPQRGYIIYCTPDNVWQFWIGAGSGWAQTTGPAVELGEWTHVSGVYSADGMKLYINGELEAEGAGTLSPNTQQRVSIGAGATDSQAGNYYFVGKIDDVRVYDTALSQEHLKTVMDVKPYPFSQTPDPADGAGLEDTWILLSWTPGDLAVSHDVYLGEDYQSVDEATRDSDLFRGNQAATFFMAGLPGYPYPDGLTHGVTYYWRIDQVNEADPNSPWKGDVWSFFVRPKTAWQPSPADGMKFVDPNEKLSWRPGIGARLYQVYFGESFDDVNSATDAPSISQTTYDPGPLELDKTYYWRVDALDSRATLNRGIVWSLTVTRGGGGLLGTYYNNENLSGTPIVTRVDPQINFDWGDGTPDESIEARPYSARWLGEVEAVFTEPYKFIAVVGDGVRLWLNGELIIDQWIVGGALPYPSKPVNLVAGLTYSIRIEYVNSTWWPAAAQLFWSSASTPEQLVPQGAFSLPVKAGAPKPAMGGVDVSNTPTLKWMAGIHAVQHEAYFGTDANAVKNATTASPEHKGTLDLGSESYKPDKLDLATTYYWRVDEVNNVNPDSPWVGNVWSFTTGEFLTVDDFEDYDVGNNEIWWSWKDGFGYPAREDEGIPAYSGNGTGSIVGDETSPTYTEMTIVHGGSQSMPLLYDNDKQGYAKYSETELALPTGKRDWTAKGASELSLWFRGEEDNAAERLYVVVAGTAVIYHDDANAAQLTNWTEWIIPLQRLADEGVSLTSIDSIAIGLGSRGNTTIPGGAGVMYIDDIRLYWPKPQQ